MMAEESNEVTSETTPEATETTPEVTETPEVSEGAETVAEENAPKETPKESKEEVTSKTAPPMPENTHFIWGTGRRKAAIARVRIRPGTGKITVNKREMTDYFTTERDRQSVVSPLKVAGMLKSYDIWVNVGGGGYTGQAGAVMLGLARALSRHIPEIEHDLRSKGLLTRDSRMKERKKPGQPGARKSFQFSKR
jgi:small subunit ribosomal protein S9